MIEIKGKTCPRISIAREFPPIIGAIIPHWLVPCLGEKCARYYRCLLEENDAYSAIQQRENQLHEPKRNDLAMERDEQAMEEHAKLHQ